MYGQTDPQMLGMMSFFPILLFVLIAVLFAFGFAKIAGRVGRSPVLWAILSLIPLVNYFFWIYAGFVVVLHMLDRLNAIGPGAAASTPARP